MPKRDDIQKVLIIGAGPVVIGQAGENDYAGTQACRALRSLGYQTLLVNSNPATHMTDPDIADVTYIEPLTVKVLKEIIALERPDALLPNVGGLTALDLATQLHRSGILAEYGVKLIGVNLKAIEHGEDRLAFRARAERLGIATANSTSVASADNAEKATAGLGFPVVVRPANALDGSPSGLVYNVDELITAVSRGIAASRINQVLVEETLMGWEVLEVEVIRDARNQMITVGFIQNMDPVGVHPGDSASLLPRLSPATANVQARLQEVACAIMEDLEIVGGANFQFAHDMASSRIAVLEVNPRNSRSSALLSQATGLPVTEIATLLAGGLTLDEIPFTADQTMDTYIPAEDCVAVKLPVWDFEKFEGLPDQLDTMMLSTGKTLGIGKAYKEALQKAVRSLKPDPGGLGFIREYHDLPVEKLLSMTGTATSERLFIMYAALRKGADLEKLQVLTQVNPWFLRQLQELVQLEEKILAHQGKLPPDDLLRQAKEDGFGDRYLAMLLQVPEEDIRVKRIDMGMAGSPVPVPVCGTENAVTYFSSYHPVSSIAVEDKRKIMILGNGPNRIGESAEFDYCCAQVAAAIQAAGCESILLNCNPASVSTDHAVAGKLYFDPVTLEDALRIYAAEKPEGVIVQLGGATALDLAGELAAAGVTILGTPPQSIAQATDRDRFREIVQKLGIPQPNSGKADNLADAQAIATRIGYPLIVRPVNVINGRGREVIQDETMLKQYIAATMEISAQNPLRIDQFLDNAIEAEADAITDGQDAFVPEVMEQIELAGIHSGDSACVIPPISLAPKHIETIREYTRKIAAELKVVGLMNIHFAIYNNTVYALEAKPGASRNIPRMSKVCAVAMAKLATRVLLGTPLADLGLEPRHIAHYGIKESVFPFNRYQGVDPALGLEMRSTGEVLGLSNSFGRAIFKAQEATQSALPLEGTILLTIADRDKTAALEPARLFRELGFRIMATIGTHRFLKENGIESLPAKKLGYGRPDLVDAIKNGEVNLLVDTPSGRQSSLDSAAIRQAAIKYNVPYITTTAATIAAAKGIAARREGVP